MSSECYVCSMNEQAGSLPVREEIWSEGGWRVAHAFDTSLPGWLVVVPTRHVTALHELEPAEATTLGGLLARASTALREVVGCQKTYTMLFAEAEGFGHLHVHLVPRMPDFTAEQVGPRVFTFLGAPEGERLSEAERDRVARRLRETLAA